MASGSKLFAPRCWNPWGGQRQTAHPACIQAETLLSAPLLPYLVEPRYNRNASRSGQTIDKGARPTCVHMSACSRPSPLPPFVPSPTRSSLDWALSSNMLLNFKGDPLGALQPVLLRAFNGDWNSPLQLHPWRLSIQKTIKIEFSGKFQLTSYNCSLTNTTL